MASGFTFGVGAKHAGFSPSRYRLTLDDVKAAKLAAKQQSSAVGGSYDGARLAGCGGVSSRRTFPNPTRLNAVPSPSEREEESPTPIHDVPEEILLAIFKLLDLADLARSVIPVCSRWHRLGRDESLWARETLRYDPLSESPDDFICALTAAPVLRAVEYISDNSQTRQDVAEALCQGCPRVLSLTLLQWHQTSALLRKVLEHLGEHLQHLQIFIPDLSLVIPISYMHSLKYLVLHGEISYVTDLLLKLGTGCQFLTTLDLGGLRFNDIFQLDSLMEAVVRGHADHLVSLKLPPNLTSALVLDAVALCTKLKVLAIWITPHITTATLVKSLSQLKLESLTWRNYDGWLDSVELAQFILYSDVFQRLTEFCLIDCIDMDDGLATAISHRCQNLLKLSLHRSELSEDGLYKILTNASHLVSLDLYKNTSFSVDHLRLISSHLPELRNLDIRRCYSIRSISNEEWERIVFDLAHVNIKFD